MGKSPFQEKARQRTFVRVEGMGFTSMKRLFCVLVACAAVCGAGVTANAEPAASRYLKTNSQSFMRIFGPAQPPYGFLRFCKINPGYCASEQIEVQVSARRFDAPPQRLSQLDKVNREVNEAIAPHTDQEIYGVAEYWTMPTTLGDCEDYALLKRERLANLGWPRSSLLMTVVRDEQGEGHAVLTVRTKQGDFVLDNKIADVRLWSDTPYNFVMRQSYVNPMVWVSLDKTYAAEFGFKAGASGN